jgi:hypothetical protein
MGPSGLLKFKYRGWTSGKLVVQSAKKYFKTCAPITFGYPKLGIEDTCPIMSRTLKDLKHDANGLAFIPPCIHENFSFSKRHSGAHQPVIALCKPRSLTSWWLCSARLALLVTRRALFCAHQLHNRLRQRKWQAVTVSSPVPLCDGEIAVFV